MPRAEFSKLDYSDRLTLLLTPLLAIGKPFKSRPNLTSDRLIALSQLEWLIYEGRSQNYFHTPASWQIRAELQAAGADNLTPNTALKLLLLAQIERNPDSWTFISNLAAATDCDVGHIRTMIRQLKAKGYVETRQSRPGRVRLLEPEKSDKLRRMMFD